MIFGRPPWNCKSIADLQNKVKTQSGVNLPIPSTPPISEDCKELLRGLIEPDPIKRIEWIDFFNNKLFESQKQETPQDMRQSVMFRNQEDKVTELFQQNKKQVDKEAVDLEEDPRKIKLNITPKQNDYNSNAEQIIEKARRRYTHEKKMIVFMMHACRRLRNLAKQRQVLGVAANGLMFIGLLLLKKGILLNLRAINSISNRRNHFGITDFELFLQTGNCNKILMELEKDSKLYFTLINHLLKKVEEEVGLSNANANRLSALSSDPNCSLETIQAELDRELGYLIEYQAHKGASLPAAINSELKTTLAHSLLSSRCDQKFPFLSTEMVPFDWRQFENDIKKETFIMAVLRDY